MRFTTTPSQLLPALTRAKSVMVPAPPLVAYTGTLLRVKHNQLHLSGSDGETTITVALKVTDTSEGEALLVPGPLAEYLGRLPGNEELTVQLADAGDVLVQRTGRKPYRFRQLGSTFPPPVTGGKDMKPINVPLADALGAVKHAHSGVVQLRSINDTLTVSATDGYRIARVRLTGAGADDLSCVLHFTGAVKLAEDNPTNIGIDAKGRVLRAKSDTSFTVIRLVDEAFPDVDAVTEGFVGDTLTIDSKELLAALACVVPVAGKTPVKLVVEGDQMTLSAENVEVGAGSEILKVGNASGPLTCYVNGTYLIDALSVHKTTVTFGWNGALAPLHFRSTVPYDIRTVVMPVQA